MSKKLIIILLISIAVIAASWFILKTPRALPGPEQKPPIVVPDIVKWRAFVLQSAKIDFPNIFSREKIEVKQLPVDLAGLVFNNGDNSIILEKISYIYRNKATGRPAAGYLMEFNYGLSVSTLGQTYKDILSKKNWKILSNIKTDFYGILEAENSKYKMRINLERKNDNLTNVFFEVWVK